MRIAAGFEQISRVLGGESPEAAGRSRVLILLEMALATSLFGLALAAVLVIIGLGIEATLDGSPFELGSALRS